MFHKAIGAASIFGMIILLAGCATKEEKLFKSFVKAHVEKVKPLLKERNFSYWKATASGKKEEYGRYAQLDLEVRTIYSDRQDFSQLKQWKESGQVKDSLLARQLTLLYNTYLGNQIDSTLMREIVEISTAVEEKFNTFRATIDAEDVSTKQIYEILGNYIFNKPKARFCVSSKIQHFNPFLLV